ncbi:MAG TPA: hypothetical protein DCE52_11865, partial [Rhodobacteraceae bacterium]|nr:hypothetical protein [Paracoccaceae bacterium]
TENPTIGNGFAAFYNVLERPAEISPQAGPVSWLRFPIGKFLTDHLETFERHPAIAPGTPDPYVPND